MGMDYPATETNPTPYELGNFGAFTSTKYLLMLDALDLKPADFEVLPSAKAGVIRERFVKYLTERFDNGDPALEKDGRLMWVNGVTKWKSYQYTW